MHLMINPEGPSGNHVPHDLIVCGLSRSCKQIHHDAALCQ